MKGRRAAILVACGGLLLGCSQLVGIGDLNIEAQAPNATDAGRDGEELPRNDGAAGWSADARYVADAASDDSAVKPTDDSAVTPTDDSAVTTDPPLGDGRDGTLVVSTHNMVVNAYRALASPLSAGAVDIDVKGDLKPFAPGDMILVWQARGLANVPAPGARNDLDLTSTTETVGAWEIARVAQIASSGTRLTLTKPIANAYVGQSQIVRVPQYTNVYAGTTSSLAAGAWDGSTGGILALVATGDVNLDGKLDVSGAGLRGGSTTLQTHFGCTGTSGAPADGYAARGEGLASASPVGGRGNVALGGGGGDCHNAGGGGGGHGGIGGQGGFSWDEGRDVGGLGGQRAVYKLASRMLLGGGGGAGDGNDGTGSDGGRGGGIVFIRAARVVGKGKLIASGQAGTYSDIDGAGGGGAGGAIFVTATTSIACFVADASGGNGGGVNQGDGPGGGGAGGHVLLAAPDVKCPAIVNAGVAGSLNGDRRGATPSDANDPTARGVVEGP